MINALPIHLFLNEALVDKLWTLATGEPTTVEKAKEVAGQLATKGEFKFGKLWSWIAADVDAELSGKASTKTMQKLEYSSMLRSILLRGEKNSRASMNGSARTGNRSSTIRAARLITAFPPST
jgi:hypothetical protein